MFPYLSGSSASYPQPAGISKRPALTHLAVLAIADPSILERLLRGDPIDVAVAHPHYAVALDARDHATLTAIRARSHTIEEFLSDLADVVDGPTA